MILSLLFLLISSSQQHGSDAEFSHSNKFQHTNIKEQNGVQDPQHEKIVTISEDGTVHSPDFPRSYPRNIVLVWRLVAVNRHARIQLTFDERFGLEDPEDGECKYDFVEIEDPAEGTVLGRWCGSQSVPGKQVSRGNQIRIRFVSDEYFPSEPGFSIHYSLLSMKLLEPEVPAVPRLPPLQTLDALTKAVAGLETVEEVMKYLEPERWQLDIDELSKPTWHVLGKSFIQTKKSKGLLELNQLKEEAWLYSCTPRNLSVSLREELRRTDAIFWPGCLLVKRCGGNCGCCSHRCLECQCVATRVTKKYHEVLLIKHRSGGRGLQKSLTDVPLEHHEECDCVCKQDAD